MKQRPELRHFALDPRIRIGFCNLRHRFQIGRIQILFVGKGSIHAHGVIVNGDPVHFFNDLFPDLRILNQFLRDLCREFFPALRRFSGKSFVVHENDHRQHQHRVKNHHESAAPCPQNTCHFLFMRILCSIAATAGPQADAPVQHIGKNGDQNKEDIEIPEFFHIVWIEKTFAFDPVGQHRQHIAFPREFPQHEKDEEGKHRIGKKSLDRIGNDQCDAAAEKDHRNG